MVPLPEGKKARKFQEFHKSRLIIDKISLMRYYTMKLFECTEALPRERMKIVFFEEESSELFPRI